MQGDGEESAEGLARGVEHLVQELVVEEASSTPEFLRRRGRRDLALLLVRLRRVLHLTAHANRLAHGVEYLVRVHLVSVYGPRDSIGASAVSAADCRASQKVSERGRPPFPRARKVPSLRTHESARGAA